MRKSRLNNSRRLFAWNFFELALLRGTQASPEFRLIFGILLLPTLSHRSSGTNPIRYSGEHGLPGVGVDLRISPQAGTAFTGVPDTIIHSSIRC